MTEDPGQHKEGPKNHSASNEAMEQAVKPKQSYWPIVLAASLTLTLVGVVFVIVSFVGWGLERH